MKTIQMTKEVPQLKINYSTEIESPRNDDTICLLVLKGCYGDKNEELQRLLNETYRKATSAPHHLELMRDEVSKIYGNVVYSDFITKYEHSSVCLKRGLYKGFDYGLIGFVFVTDRHVQSFGVASDNIEKLVDNELQTYNQWLNGEIYEYRLYNNEGEVIESCSGFYDIDSIKEYLPKEWQHEDMKQYLVIE